MILSYPAKNIAIFLWKTLVPLIFCWKLDHFYLCLGIWKAITPYRNSTALFSTVLELTRLTNHRHGGKEENKSMIAFMSRLWTFHLFLNINTKLHKNAYSCVECIQKQIVHDMHCTNYLLEQLLTTILKKYRIGNNVIISWHPFS